MCKSKHDQRLGKVSCILSINLIQIVKKHKFIIIQQNA